MDSTLNLGAVALSTTENFNIIASSINMEAPLKPLAIFLLGLGLSGCGQREPRSVQYFEANPDDAREVTANCQEGSIRGDECANAKIALEVIESRERFARFRGKK